MSTSVSIELPQSDEAERSVLGAILVDNRRLDEVADVLTPDDFYRSAHQRIFRSMLEMSDASQPIDLITLAERHQNDGALDAVGGVTYLSRLMDGIPRLVNVRHYAGIVRERSVRRQLVRTANELAAEAALGESDVEQMLGSAERRIFAIAERRMAPGFAAMKELLGRSLDDIEKRQQHAGQIAGVPTGFSELDELTSGLQPGDLIILAARPSMGKTAMALSAAQNAAVRFGKKVAIFSLEMSGVQLAMRILCSEARVDAQKMRRGQLNDRHWAKLIQAYGRLAQAPIFIDETSGISVTEMRAKVRRLAAEHGLDLIVVDYLQLVGSSGRSENRQQEISAISRSLKEMARELNVPVLALSQLSRAPDQRQGDHRPMLSDLRESGCLSGDTLVALADGGRARMADLVGREGVDVWALDETTCKLSRARVSRAFSTGVKPIFRLTTRSGRSIRASANHRFRTFEGWRRLDELAAGSRLALPRHLPASTTAEMSADELALLGHLIGDGCTLPRHAMQYTTRERELAEEVVTRATRIFGSSIAARIVSERRWLQVYLAAAERLTRGRRNPVAAWLDELGVMGLRSHEKRVPEIVFRQPRAEVATFLRHLWSTDGTIHVRRVGDRAQPTITYSTSSARLASDVQSLLLRCDIQARKSRVPQPGKGRDQYHVAVTGAADQSTFVEVIGAVGSRRSRIGRDVAALLAERVPNTNRDTIPREAWHDLVLPAARARGMSHRALAQSLGMSYCGSTLYQSDMSRGRASRVAMAVESERLEQLATSDVYWDSVVAIEPDGEEEVFDLTVPGPHNFVANDIVVHNSLEQDADVVAFIFREEVYRIREGKDAGDKKGIAEIIIGKQRNGPTDTVKLAFIKEWTRFENLQREGFAGPAGDDEGGAGSEPGEAGGSDDAPF